MTRLFDPGYAEEPFRTLASEYPGGDIYPPGQFRLEWGPISTGAGWTAPRASW